MKVLLVNPPSPKGKILIRSYAGGYGIINTVEDMEELLPPIELMSIGGALLDKGIDVELIDYQTVDFNENELRIKVIQEGIDVIVTMLSPISWKSDSSFAKKCKKINNSIRVYARTNIIFEDLTNQIIKNSKIDGVISAWSIKDIDLIVKGELCDNMAYLDENNNFVISKKSHIRNIDMVPKAARHLADHKYYSFVQFNDIEDIDLPKSYVTTMHTSYGCSYKCGYYCPYVASEGNQVKMISVEKVIKELKEIKSLGIKGVSFRDPNFTYKKQRIIEMCREMITNKIDIPWWCETRIDKLDYELMRIMKEAGCIGFDVGVESGDEEFISEHAKPGLKLESVHKFINTVKELDMHCALLFMVGLPNEKPQNIYKTFKLILDLDLKFNEYNLTTVLPYPGTHLYSDAKKRDWIQVEEDMYSYIKPMVRNNTLNKDAIVKINEFKEELNEMIKKRSQYSKHEWSEKKLEFERRVEKWALKNQC
ncbi:radical SAM protein [Clostridiaceae bacterium M8S5]|nr:radical SAM protein [Clostridiaceae bacterium M8S5]